VRDARDTGASTQLERMGSSWLTNTGRTSLRHRTFLPRGPSHLARWTRFCDEATKVPEEQQSLSHFAAKDILRAAGLPLLAADDPEVAADLEKVRFGTKLCPVRPVYGDPLWIADGYHRVCASYHLSEKVLVPCRIAPR
jgi:hypothetical protein